MDNIWIWSLIQGISENFWKDAGDARILTLTPGITGNRDVDTGDSTVTKQWY